MTDDQIKHSEPVKPGPPSRIWWNPEGHWSSWDDSEIRQEPSVPFIPEAAYIAQAELLREAVEALGEAEKFIMEHVWMTAGYHENPPEPGDRFSYEAGPVVTGIRATLAKIKGGV